MRRKALIWLLTLAAIISTLGIMPMTTYAATEIKNIYDAEILPDGKIAIVYISAGEIYYGVLDPTTNNWIKTKATEGKNAALDIDSNGYPHIAYITNDDNLGYTYYNGSSWSTPEILDSIAFGGVDGALTAPDIAVDSNGKAHIIYFDAKGGYTGSNNYGSYDGADLIYANNTGGSFVKTVRYYGEGWYEYTGWGYNGEYWRPLAPAKIILSDSGYKIGVKHDYFWRDTDPNYSYHTYSFKLLSLDPAADLSYTFGSSDALLGMNSDGINAFSLINTSGTLCVLNGVTEIPSATKTFSAAGADIFATDNSNIFYAGISSNTLLLYQDGSFKENITLPVAISSVNKNVATLTSDGQQYVLYTDIADDLWVCNVSTSSGDTSLNTFKIPDKLPVTISGVSVESKEYNGEPVVPGGTLAVTGGDLNAEDLTFTYTSTDGGGYSSTTPPTNAGNYKLVISVPEANSTYTGSSADIFFSITQKTLTVTGTTAINRDYDPGNTYVALDTSNSVLSGVLTMDEATVSLDKSGAAGTISDANAAIGKPVTTTGFALTGAGIGNYTLAQPTGVTVDILPLTLTAPTATLSTDNEKGGLTVIVSDSANSAGVASYVVEVYQGTNLKKTIDVATKGTAVNIELEDAAIIAEVPYTAKAKAIADTSGNYSDSPLGDASASAVAAYGPLVFIDSTDYNIPASSVGSAIIPINVSSGVSGGKLPYIFSATGLPAWAAISSDGLLSGTPTAVAAGGTATLIVTDALGNSQNISITYGEVGKGNPQEFQGVLPPTVKTYGDAPFDINLTYDDTASNVAYFIESGPGTISGNILTITGAGEIVVKVVGTSDNYQDKVQYYTILINRKAVTITPIAETNTKVYGGVDPTLAFANSALVAQDTLSGTILERTPGENAGSYPISIAGSAAVNNPNYQLSLAAGIHNFTITKKPLTITAASVSSKPYDGTSVISANAVTAVTLNGDIDAMVLTTDFEVLSASHTGDAYVGINKATVITIGLKDTSKANNYMFEIGEDTFTGATADITPATQTITAANQALAVGNTLDLSTIASSNATGALLTFSIEGGTSDYATLAGSFLTGSAEGEVTININSAAVNIAGTIDNEYSAAVQKQITVTVSAKEIGDSTITFDDHTVIYGEGYAPGPTTTLTGGTWTYSYSGTALDGEDYSGSVAPSKAGSYLVTATYENSTHIGMKSASLTISPKNIAISGITASDREYDGTTFVAITGGVLEGLLDGDTVTANVPTTGTLEDAMVGNNKTVNINEIPLVGADKDNYTLVQPTGIKVNILPKEITFSVDAIDSQDYTGVQLMPDPVVRDGSTTLIKNADYTVVYGANINAGTNAGTVTITGIGNYEGSSASSTFTINKIPYSGAAVTGTKQVFSNTSATDITFDLTELSFPAGFVDISFVAATLGDNTDGLLGSGLSISGNTLTFDVASCEAGKSGVINVTVISTNYTDYQVSISVSTVDRPTSGGGSSYTPPAIVISTDKTNTSTTNSINISPTSTSATSLANMSTAIVDALLDKAEATAGSGKEDILEVLVDTPADTASLEITLEQNNLQKITSRTDSSFKINSSFLTINFNGKALETISEADSGGSIVISASVVDKSTLSEKDKAKVQNRPVYDLTVKNGNTQVSHLGGGHATVTIPYTLKIGENPNTVVVYYLADDGSLKTVRGHYDAAKNTVVFKTPHFSKFAIGYNPVSFSDVISGAWYKKAVEFIAARDITSGTGNDEFSPNDKLTRAQFMVMLMKAYQIETQDGEFNTVENFADAGSTYYTDYLLAAKGLGIVNGLGNNLFAPDREVTRQEMFVMLYNALKVLNEVPTGNEASSLTEVKQLTDFNDSYKIAAWAKEPMATLVDAGIVTGSNDNVYPKSTTTRAEIAQVLYNLMVK